MNLVEIKDYEGLYSFDLNTNQVWGHTRQKYIKPDCNKFTNYTYIWLWKNCKRKSYLFHRLIYQYNNLDTDIRNLIIDHKDRDSFNNNLDNLRIATKSENCCNQKVRVDNKLGLKNIKWNNYSYVVRITKNKIVYHKSLKTLNEAIEWRDFKLREIHNEFSSNA
tara:strand:- start:949 stop:1440 length:492 start_codon:yes stop_codon:yes gene_type:complete